MSQSQPDLAEYRSKVESARTTGRSVDNFSKDHASILTKEIIAASSSSVEILCCKLDQDVYALVAEEGSNFVNRGGYLRIIVETDLDWPTLRSHKFVDSLICGGVPGHFDIRYLPDAAERHRHNFVVGDKCHVRDEPNRNVPAAQGQFCDAQRGATLSQEHERLFGLASEITGRPQAPQFIRLEYTFRDGVHLFKASTDLQGLRVGSRDLEEAADELPTAAGLLVWVKFARVAHYRLSRGTGSPDQFQLELIED
jgi:hypothetical protein